MPIIREMSNLEKIALMYYGKSKSKILPLMHSMNMAFTAAGYRVSNIGGGKAGNIIDF